MPEHSITNEHLIELRVKNITDLFINDYDIMRQNPDIIS